ncbi:MAG TPA: hypothetical protein VFQ61_06605 [Polyangiaceae bacterium]|nr:hypothetical protein [Polyangiaceae bacterium]
MADRIEVRTILPSKAALFAGVTQCGTILVAPTAEQIAALDSTDRELLGEILDARRELVVSSPGWEGVLAQLRVERHRKAQAEADLNARKESDRQSLNEVRSLAEQRALFKPGEFPLVQRCYYSLSTYRDPEIDELQKSTDQTVDECRRAFLSAADEELGLSPSSHIVGEGEAATVSEVVRNIANEGRRFKVPTPAAAAIQAAAREIRQTAERVAAEAKARLAAEQRAELRSIVAQAGTEDQLERFDEGLLPEAELAAVVRSKVFAQIKFPSYAKLKPADVASALECEPSLVKFSTREYDGPLTREQFARLKQIRALAPEGAVVDIREHVAYDSERTGADDPEVVRLGIRVTAKVGGQKFSAEFAISDDFKPPASKVR